MDNLPNLDPTTLLSTEDVSKHLNVTPRAVQKWAKAKSFPNAQRVGSGKKAPYIIPWGDVLAYLESKNK